MTDKYEKLRLNAYYYSFEPTNIYKVDKVLSAMATAGKSYHSTEYWNEKMYGSDLSYVENIQKEANELAEEYKKLASVAQEMGEIVEMIDTEQFITGDSIKRTNPHSKIMLNSGSSWLVTKDLGSQINGKEWLNKVRQALAKFKEK